MDILANKIDRFPGKTQKRRANVTFTENHIHNRFKKYITHAQIRYVRDKEEHTACSKNQQHQAVYACCMRFLSFFFHIGEY